MYPSFFYSGLKKMLLLALCPKYKSNVANQNYVYEDMTVQSSQLYPHNVATLPFGLAAQLVKRFTRSQRPWVRIPRRLNVFIL